MNTPLPSISDAYSRGRPRDVGTWTSRGRLVSQRSLRGRGITLAIVFKLGEFYYVQSGDFPLHGTRLLTRFLNLTAWRRHRLVLHSGDALRCNRRSIDQKRATFLVGATQSAATGPRTLDAANS